MYLNAGTGSLILVFVTCFWGGKAWLEARVSVTLVDHTMRIEFTDYLVEQR
jgi:hypothetical protein